MLAKSAMALLRAKMMKMKRLAQVECPTERLANDGDELLEWSRKDIEGAELADEFLEKNEADETAQRKQSFEGMWIVHYLLPIDTYLTPGSEKISLQPSPII